MMEVMEEPPEQVEVVTWPVPETDRQPEAPARPLMDRFVVVVLPVIVVEASATRPPDWFKAPMMFKAPFAVLVPMDTEPSMMVELLKVPVEFTVNPPLNVWSAVQTTDEAAVTKLSPFKSWLLFVAIVVDGAKYWSPAGGIIHLKALVPDAMMFHVFAAVEVAKVNAGPVSVVVDTWMVVVAGAAEI